MRSRKETRRKTRMTKPLFFLLSLCFSMVVFIGATYAWLTYSDARINRIEAGDYELKIAIQGELGPVILTPNQQTKRNISVRNDSKVPVFVRLSLKELLLMYEIDVQDQTGNANLKDYSSGAPSATIQLKDLSTWQTNQYYKDGNKNRIYKSIEKTNYNYKEDLVDRGTTPLEYLGLNFINYEPSTPNPTMYWIYYQGYFYYSERIYPENSTSILLDSIQLQEQTPNGVKGSFYGQEWKGEAALSTEQVFTAWGIPKTVGNPVYDLLKPRLE